MKFDASGFLSGKIVMVLSSRYRAVRIHTATRQWIALANRGQFYAKIFTFHAEIPDRERENEHEFSVDRVTWSRIIYFVIFLRKDKNFFWHVLSLWQCYVTIVFVILFCNFVRNANLYKHKFHMDVNIYIFIVYLAR